jgi:DinB superfamily
MQNPARRLLHTVERVTPRLLALDDAATARRPAPGRWSPREIVGHLIDSASNNHQRFVRAQFQEDLVFPGYAQDAWVAAQRYQHAPWRELVGLWTAFNRHLANVIAVAPEDVRMKPRERHNLHQIAFRTVPQDQPATLDYFMRDYVDHLEHHLKQILGPEALA